jgi:hypothetical protein
MKPATLRKRMAGLTLVQQRRAAAWVSEGGVAAACERVRDWFNLMVTEKELAEFFAWQSSDRPVETSAGFATRIAELLKGPGRFEAGGEPGVMAGQAILEARAVAEDDVKVLKTLRALRQKDQLVALATRKVVLLERRAARVKAAEEAAKPPPEKKLSQEEKQRKIEEYFNLTMPIEPGPAATMEWSKAKRLETIRRRHAPNPAHASLARYRCVKSED